LFDILLDSFIQVEKKFQARFSEKIEAAQLASRLAVNNNARSLLTITQQQAVIFLVFPAPLIPI